MKENKMRHLAITLLAILTLAASAGAQEASADPPRTTYGDAYLGMPFEEWLSIDSSDVTMTTRCAHSTDGDMKKGCEAWAQFKETARAGEVATFPIVHPETNAQGMYGFRSKRLAIILLVCAGQRTGYETQLVTLTRKYGAPTKTDSAIDHDAYGATWVAHTTTWEMPDGAAIKLSDGDDRDHTVTLVEFQSKEEVSRANAATRQEVQKQNP